MAVVLVVQAVYVFASVAFSPGRMVRSKCVGATALLTNFVVATSEFRGSGAGERTEYHNVVAWF